MLFSHFCDLSLLFFFCLFVIEESNFCVFMPSFLTAETLWFSFVEVIWRTFEVAQADRHLEFLDMIRRRTFSANEVEVIQRIMHPWRPQNGARESVVHSVSPTFYVDWNS